MKKSIKGFVVGLVAGLVISCICVGAFQGVVQKELSYNDVKITLNGQTITPTDANGNVVEPFIIDGTTYLPVRAIANALGLDVKWDGETNTVKLGKDSGNVSDSEDIPSGVGSVIYDKNGVKITYKEVKEYDSERHYVFLIENNSDEAKCVSFGSIYVNGYAVGEIASYGGEIKPNKNDTRRIYIYNGELDECDITKIETMEFDVIITPESIPLDGSGCVEETIIFNP